MENQVIGVFEVGPFWGRIQEVNQIGGFGILSLEVVRSRLFGDW
jgi:hypothetical protein